MKKLVVLLQIFAAGYACSFHKTVVTCRDEVVSDRANYTTDVIWKANPALHYDYQYTRSDAGLAINLKAMWRVLKWEKFATPITSFEISLLDLTENRFVEVRNAAISSPEEGIRNLAESVDFFTSFTTSLEFGHDYEIELRFLPLGTNGSFKKRLSIPAFPASGDCEKDSSLAHDKDKYAIYVSETKKYPLTSTVHLAFHTAPRVFCFSEYTIEVHETANPAAVYAKVIVAPTAATQVIKHEFADLPMGVYLSIKIFPTEAVHSRASECVCTHCNCLVAQTKSFKFPAPEAKKTPLLEIPSISDAESTFLGRNLANFLLIPILIVLIAIMAMITWILRKFITPPKESVKLVSDWNKEEKMPIVTSPPLLRDGVIWVIGLNSFEERSFLHKLSTYLHPSAKLIFAPDDLPDGENRFKWMSAVSRGVDTIVLLLREPSLSLYSAGIASTSDPYEILFIEQISMLHPSDTRIVTVSLDDSTPSLFNSTSLVFHDPRDFPLLTQCLFYRGFPLADSYTPPLSPSISIRSASASERSSSERVSEGSSQRSSVEGEMSKDSGFISNPSPPLARSTVPQRSSFPYIEDEVIPAGYLVPAN